MATIKQISQTIEESSSLKLVAQAYSEISVVKLQKIRRGIEKNRLFTEEIAGIYHMVQTAASSKSAAPGQNKQGTVSILLTSNDRFYGGLETDLTNFFLVNTTKIKTDRVVIGHTASTLLKSMNYFHPYQTMILQSDLPASGEFHQLSGLISRYRQVLVYYSSFKSVLVQKPNIIDITQSANREISQSRSSLKFDYIFEPEVTEMLDFFNNQITVLLLEQTFYESELARTAARLISMDQAQSKATELIKQQQRLLASAKRSLDNINLLETIASLRSLQKVANE